MHTRRRNKMIDPNTAATMTMTLVFNGVAPVAAAGVLDSGRAD
jgi:hypothetical protein